MAKRRYSEILSSVFVNSIILKIDGQRSKIIGDVFHFELRMMFLLLIYNVISRTHLKLQLGDRSAPGDITHKNWDMTSRFLTLIDLVMLKSINDFELCLTR